MTSEVASIDIKADTNYPEKLEKFKVEGSYIHKISVQC